MLKILFSPSETKKLGGEALDTTLFGATNARDEILQSYETILKSHDALAICNLFGTKKLHEDWLEYLAFEKKMPAIERYTGVAYEYLDYASLDTESKEHILERVIIFSNLFGPILASDTIYAYKVKQGNKVGTIAPESFYLERFGYQLDLFLQNHEILDLRAGYYDKFYKIKSNYTTMKFLKNGKSVSHWAKAYRGVILREIATAKIQTLQQLQAHNFQGITLKEIKVIKNMREIIYEIL